MKRLTIVLLSVTLVLGYQTPAKAQPSQYRDAVDLSKAVINGGPADVASWPATQQITEVSVSPSNGWAFDGGFHAAWPDVRIFNPSDPRPCSVEPDGCLQYTVWPVVKIGGIWHTCGVVQMWRGRPSTGAFGEKTWHDDLPNNWTYICGDAGSYRPNVGDDMGFFVTAGNARRYGQVSSVRERSNVVMVRLPANDTGIFTFLPQPTPTPVPDPTPAPTPQPPTELEQVVKMLSQAVIDLSAHLNILQDFANDTSARVSALEEKITALETTISELSARPVWASCSASVLGIPVHCALR